jgi:hypothetical protein
MAKNPGSSSERLQVFPESETLLTIQTDPHAVCHLRHASRPEEGLQLDADERGIVRFHARAAKGAKPIELVIHSVGEHGRASEHSVTISADAPHPTVAAAAPRPGRPSHPPLAGADLTLSNRELLARGYPPRPDPTASPARYARWLRRVSEPFDRVNDKRTPHPSVRFGRAATAAKPPPRAEAAPATTKAHPGLQLFSPTLPLPPPMARSVFNQNSGIWSGAYLNRPNGQFFWIEADWNAPGVFALSGGPAYSAVAEWIGLDNSGTDLYQTGTDSECWDFSIFGWTFTNYWMWIELLPFAPWGVPNFPVSPGDSISADIFVADQNGMTWFQNNDEGNDGLTGADNSVWFMLYNNTQHASYWGTLPTAPVSLSGYNSTGFTGTTAEFILERPSDLSSGTPYPLAFFGLAAMRGCVYGDALYGFHAWVLEADGSSPFDGNLAYLNMTGGSGNLLALPISVPDPSGSGGSEIVWIWTGSS